MEQLTFGLIQPHDITILQQMIQGTAFSGMKVSCMSFNRYASPIFIARSQGNIVGFTSGQKGSGDQSDVMTIRGTYLYNHYNDPQHQSELQLALVRWAEKKLDVTHYKLDDFDIPKPISISHVIPAVIPPQKIETLDCDMNFVPQMSEPNFQPEYAYH